MKKIILSAIAALLFAGTSMAQNKPGDSKAPVTQEKKSPAPKTTVNTGHKKLAKFKVKGTPQQMQQTAPVKKKSVN